MRKAPTNFHITSSLNKDTTQLQLSASVQSSVAVVPGASAWWHTENPNRIHASIRSRLRYSQGMVSVWAGLSSWPGLDTRESIWALRHCSALRLRRG